MSVQLTNRQAIRVQLSQFIEDMAIPEEMIKWVHNIWTKFDLMKFTENSIRSVVSLCKRLWLKRSSACSWTIWITNWIWLKNCNLKRQNRVTMSRMCWRNWKSKRWLRFAFICWNKSTNSGNQWLTIKFHKMQCWRINSSSSLSCTMNGKWPKRYVANTWTPWAKFTTATLRYLQSNDLCMNELFH